MAASIDWDGCELDFIPLPTMTNEMTTVATSHSHSPAPKPTKTSYFWWSERPLSPSPDPLRLANRLPLTRFLSSNGFCLSRQSSSEITIGFQPLGGDGVVSSVAQCVDGVQPCVFAGHFNIAVSILDIARESLGRGSVEEKTLLGTVLDGVETLVKSMIDTTHDELFYYNVTLSLVAEWLFEYHHK